MTILALLGSPRKGNTLSVVRRLDEHLQQAGHDPLDLVMLRDLDLRTCRGCFQCIQRGPERCPLHDDRADLLDRMLASTGVIFASPAYNFTVTAGMKNLIDRLAYLGHRPELFGQHAMIVATAAGTGHRQTRRYLHQYVTKLWGFRSTTSLALITPPYPKKPSGVAADDRRIQHAARRYHTRLTTKTWTPSLHHIEQFCSMRAIFSSDAMAKSFPADHAYYNTLLDQRFYDDTPVNPLTYLWATAQARLLGTLIRRTIQHPAD